MQLQRHRGSPGRVMAFSVCSTILDFDLFGFRVKPPASTNAEPKNQEGVLQNAEGHMAQPCQDVPTNDG